MDDYLPRAPALQRVWSRLSEATRRKRLTEARRRHEALEAVAARPDGESERQAVARIVTWSHRSNFRRWLEQYSALGFDGLVDARISPASGLTSEMEAVACALRRMSPELGVDEIVAFLEEHHGFRTNTTKIKRLLKAAGLARRPGPPSKDSRAGQARLELGGMKLIEAAAVETGYLSTLATAVQEHVAGLPRPALPAPVDTSGRDERGRLTASYNERFRKGPDDEVGPGYQSVEVKRLGKNPDDLQIAGSPTDVLERKLYALLCSPLLGSGRWEGIRVARGELLGELCGFAYMPATLDKFTRELKYAGVSSTMWESHAGLWLGQTRSWGDERRAAVFYIDGTTKPIWTDLFSQSSKVSNVGRTMPALEQVAFHSGYGVPLWMVTHSGRAPLVSVVPGLLDRIDKTWGDSSVGRIVVIDAEGNSIPFLKGLEQGDAGRAWVTRLRPSMVQNKRIFNRVNYRPYREGDRVRMGVADFNDPEAKGATFRMRVVEVERRSSGEVTYLGASMKLREQEWKPQQLADLYFDRWPNQEADFRAVNRAVGSKQVHGYGKKLVDNISVITKLDDLAGKLRGVIERKEAQQQLVSKRSEQLKDEQKLLRKRQGRLETVEKHLEPRLVEGERLTAKTQRLVEERKDLTHEVRKHTTKAALRKRQLEEARTRTDRYQSRIENYQEQIDKMKGMRRIFAHDVELDSIFSVLKVGMVLLINYVLKELFDNARMEPITFLERVATLPASFRTTPQLEIVTFEHNRRDPEVMGLLRSYCDAINARKLKMRSGRTLRIAVEDPPKPRIPPPPGSRTGSGDRFKR